MNGKILPLILLCAAFGLVAEGGATTQSSENQNYTNLNYGGLIPAPKEYRATGGTFEMKEPVTVYITESGTSQSGEYGLKAYLSQLSDNSFPTWANAARQSAAPASFNVKFAETEDEAQVRISIDGESGMAEEGYAMKVRPDGIGIAAGTEAGAFYAVQDILQMTRWGQTDRIPCCEISDSPRFPFRGLLVDCGHFRPKEFLMKQMDAMALFRLNKMDLILGSGHRFRIEQYPLVTGNDFYTPEDIREMLDYAALRHIDIIPTVQMPGHSGGVTRIYPELACSGTDGFAPDLCIGKEATFDFLECVIDKVVELFPSEYIHIGGDEAVKEAWKTCPDCRRRMQEEGLADVDELQSYLVRRIGRYIESKGRKMIGWDEIMEGGLAPNATVMSWRSAQAGVDAAQMGNDAIMTPTNYCYFDYYQDATFKEPKGFGSYVSLSRTYSFDPAGANPIERMEEPSEEAKAHIIGLIGCVWSGFMPTENSVEYMTYPRELAIAEVGWTPADQKEFTGFRQRALNALATLRYMGFTPFDLEHEYGDRPESLTPADHMAVGCKVTYVTPCYERYTGTGPCTLTDGLRGGWSHMEDRWNGWNGDMDVIVDLGEPREIHSVEADFMNSVNAWIFRPESVEFSLSDDGEIFTTAGTVARDGDFESDGTFMVPFSISLSRPNEAGATEGVTTRYVRLRAKVHDKPGAWIFTDEIIVR